MVRCELPPIRVHSSQQTVGEDVRFPTSLSGDGTDAMNTDCDYSSAYVKLFTDTDLTGFGMTFTIGRGNDIVCRAIEELSKRLIGKDVEELFASMGKTWDYLCADPQLRWYVDLSTSFLYSAGCSADSQCPRIGPEKGVIHIALGAVDNALWDLFARARGKPLWKLVVDMTPVSNISVRPDTTLSPEKSCRTRRR